MLQQEKRVLFFDSGVGGLSIFQNVLQVNNSIKAFYLFDHEFFPYGNKEESFLKERVLFLVKDAVVKFNIDLVVIACNTASTIVLPLLRDNIDIPIVGVVPAIKPACLQSKSKVVGLLATPGTCKREYTQNLIDKFNNGCEVIKIGSTDLVAIAENKLCGRIVNLRSIEKILEQFFDINNAVDCIILGCTHFPFLQDEIKSILKEKVFLIDSGKAVANHVKNILNIDSSISTNKDNKEHLAFYTGNLENKDKYEIAFLSNNFSSLSKYEI